MQNHHTDVSGTVARVLLGHVSVRRHTPQGLR